MIIKEVYKYKLDSSVSYSMIDGVEKIDVGIKDGVNFITAHKKNKKNETESFTIQVEDSIIYLLNDQGKTIDVIKPL